MSTELTPMEKAKLIIIDTANFSDEEAWQAFLDLDFSSEDDIYEISDVIEKHRPVVAATLAKWFGI